VPDAGGRERQLVRHRPERGQGIGDSGALASRFIVLLLTKTFFGREDQTLTGKLLTELPGILNWATEGWRRLSDRGYFVQPRSALDAVQQLEDLSSPIMAFVRECCEIGPFCSVGIDELYQAWCGWCAEQGQDHPGVKQTFGRNLLAVIPGLRPIRPRDGSEIGKVLLEQGRSGRRRRGGAHEDQKEAARAPAWWRRSTSSVKSMSATSCISRPVNGHWHGAKARYDDGPHHDHGRRRSSHLGLDLLRQRRDALRFYRQDLLLRQARPGGPRVPNPQRDRSPGAHVRKAGGSQSHRRRASDLTDSGRSQCGRRGRRSVSHRAGDVPRLKAGEDCWISNAMPLLIGSMTIGRGRVRFPEPTDLTRG
jgi:hypothetical protein